jgi:hypothetical protein
MYGYNGFSGAPFAPAKHRLLTFCIGCSSSQLTARIIHVVPPHTKPTHKAMVSHACPHSQSYTTPVGKSSAHPSYIIRPWPRMPRPSYSCGMLRLRSISLPSEYEGDILEMCCIL